MLDKLVFTPIRDFRLSLHQFREAASQHGLNIVPCNGPCDVAGYFYCIQDHASLYFKTSREGDIQRFFTNPSHFQTLTDYETFLDQLNLPRGGRWQDEMEVCRIDYAVRISRPFSELITGIDVRFRQFRRNYTDSIGHNPLGIYFGAHPDVVSVYNETEHRRRKRSNSQNNGPAVTKIERQIRQPAKVRDFAGLRTGFMIDNLRGHLNDIVNGTKDPLSSVRLQQIRILTNGELDSAALIRRAGRLQGALDMAPYGDVRRRYNRNNNFEALYSPVIERTIYPPEEQPPALLRASLAEFLELPPQTSANGNERPSESPESDSQEHRDNSGLSGS